jgi:hypothetical protein
MSFWFKTYREYSDDPQNSMLAEIYRLILQTRSEVTNTDTGSGDLEKKRVEVIPTESYIIIITGSCFVKGEARPVNKNWIYHSGWEPDTVSKCLLDFNYRQNVINDRGIFGNNASLKGLPKIVSYQPEYPPSSMKFNGIDSWVDMGSSHNLQIGEGARRSIQLEQSNLEYVDCGAQTSLWSKSLTKFTCSMWVNLSGELPADYGSIWGCSDDPSEHDEFSIAFIKRGVDANQYDTITADITNDGYTTSAQVWGNEDTTLLNNTWYHVTTTYNKDLTSGNYKLFIDAIEQDSPLDTPNYAGKTIAIDAATVLKLGQYLSSASSLDGRIRDFRFWGTVDLTQTQIQKVKDNADDAPTPDYWLMMDEGSGDPVDSISGSKTGVRTNGAGWSGTNDLPIVLSGPEITAAFWLYSDVTPSSIAYAIARGSTPSYTTYVDTDGLIKSQLFYSNNTNAILNSNISAVTAWHRVMVSHSDIDDISKLYVDGVLKTTHSVNSHLRNAHAGGASKLVLGARPYGSLLFPGVSDILNLGVQTSLWSQSLTKMSFSFDVFASDNAHDSIAYRTLVSFWDQVGGNGITVFFARDDDPTALWTDITIGAAYGDAKFQNFPMGKWVNVTVTIDLTVASPNMKIYVDAALGTTVSNLGIQTFNYPGAVGTISDPNLKGNVRDFRWWNSKVLTPTEVGKVATDDPTAPAPNYWLPMQEGYGNPVDTIASKTTSKGSGVTWDADAQGFLDGNMKNVKLWRRQLTDSEALDDYNGNYVSPVDLVAEWNFDEDEHDDTAFDSYSYNTGYIYNGIFDKTNLPFSLTANYPYIDGVVNELIGYRMTGDEYMFIPELNEDLRMDPTSGGRTYVFVIKLSTFDQSNGDYMRLFEKADGFGGGSIQTIQIRDDGRLYVSIQKDGVLVQKIRTVYPLKLNKLYIIGIGWDFEKLTASTATGDELDIIKVYLNGFRAPMEVTTANSGRPVSPDITDFHTYLGTQSTDPLTGTFVGQWYKFRAYDDLPYDDTMLALMCNKFTARAIDRGHVLVSNLSKLHETTMSRETALAGPTNIAITDVFEYFITDTTPTARFTTDIVPIDDEFEYTLTTPVHFYSLLLNGTTQWVDIPVIDPVKKHFSISVWIKYTSNTGGWGGIISRIDGMPNGNRLMVTGTKIRWHAKYGDDSDPFVNYEVTVSDMTGAWHHIAMTYDGEDDERLKLFLDGAIVLSKHQEHQIRGGPDEDEGDKSHIGKGADDNYFFGGKMDRLVIYDKTLTDSEVRKLARKEKVDTGKMAEFNFEHDFGDDADDHDFNGDGRRGAGFSTDVP